MRGSRTAVEPAAPARGSGFRGGLCGLLAAAAISPGADLRPVVERPPERAQEHEVARADARRGEQAELRPDLATDLEARNHDPDEPELEDRRARRRARARR